MKAVIRSACAAAWRASAASHVLPLQWLARYHDAVNRDTMTVVTFHRVLSREDPRWPSSLKTWTVSVPVFDACLAFFAEFYNVVSLDDALASAAGTRPLPPRSLLITFDDGYADNADYALPLLERRGLPAVLFVSSGVVGRRERLWTEDLVWAWESGEVDDDRLALLKDRLRAEGQETLPSTGSLHEQVTGIVRAAAALAPGRGERALAAAGIDRVAVDRRQMADWQELRRLWHANVRIGAHGATHAALPLAPAPLFELAEPRERLREGIGGGPIEALSFPHGLYTPELVRQAYDIGYKLVFSTQERLNRLSGGYLPKGALGGALGRIDIDASRIAEQDALRPDRLAALLFFKQRMSDAPDVGSASINRRLAS